MKCMAVISLASLLAVPNLAPAAATREGAIESLRARFADIGRTVVNDYEARKSSWETAPDTYRAARLLLEEPVTLLLEAIDEVLGTGTKEERIGALGIYGELVYERKAPLNPKYHSRLLKLLAEDDLRSPSYTRTLATAIWDYPSRETVLATLDVVARITSPDLRQVLLWNASGYLHIKLPITRQTLPEERARILTQFGEWLNKNRDRIRFDAKGRLHMGGSGFKVEKKTLDVQDRERIRKDPVCVLRLMNLTAGAEEETEDRGMALLDRCGSALYGSEGAELIRKTLVATEKGGEPSLDLQAAMGSIGGQYPVLDAALVAAAYVAAYERDHGARELARRTVEQFLEGDIDRVTRGEPREVRKAAAKLADEVAYGENKK